MAHQQIQKQHFPAKSDRSSAESWIDVHKNHHHEHYYHGNKQGWVVPDSAFSMDGGNAAAAAAAAAAGILSAATTTTVHDARPAQPSILHGGDGIGHVQPIFYNPQQLDPRIPIAQSHHYYPGNSNLGEIQQQQIPVQTTLMSQYHPSFVGSNQPHGGGMLSGGERAVEHLDQPQSSFTSLLAGSTSLPSHNKPLLVPALVGDIVRSCCATGRHALLRGHADCLDYYQQAQAQAAASAAAASAERKIAQERQTTQYSNTHHHPFGVIGENRGNGGAGTTGFQEGNIQISPPPPPLSSRPGGVAAALDDSPCLGRNPRPAGGFGPPVPGDFRPMSSVRSQANDNNNNNLIDPAELLLLNKKKIYLPPHMEERVAMGYSPRYQGNIYLEANRCADIPDELNTSLFLIHLPPTLTAHSLLAAVHRLGPTGRVFALHINAPEPLRGNMGCAAKIVFFTRAAAQLFYERCQQQHGGFQVDGRRAHITWNRIKTAERPDLVESDASRVLLIAGPREIVNPHTLTAFFRTKLEFQIDEVIVLDDNGGLPSPPDHQHHTSSSYSSSSGSGDAVVEYRFGSFRCQAQAAKMAIARMLPGVRCLFGEDPLAPEGWRQDEYTRRTHPSYSEALILGSLGL